MNAIGPGDWVEYVKEPDARLPIKRGALYCVEAIREMRVSCFGCFECDRIGLRLVGIRIDLGMHQPDFFCSRSFRPVYRPKAEIIEALRQPSPELEPA